MSADDDVILVRARLGALTDAEIGAYIAPTLRDLDDAALAKMARLVLQSLSDAELGVLFGPQVRQLLMEHTLDELLAMARNDDAP